MLYEIHTGKKYSKTIDEAMGFIIDHLDLPNNVWVDLFIVSNKDNSCGGAVDMEEDDDEGSFPSMIFDDDDDE